MYDEYVVFRRFNYLETMRLYILLALCLSPLLTAAQPDAYRLVNAQGKKTSWNKLTNAVEDADIILFGEQHDNPIAHWMQLLLAEHLLHATDSQLVIGAEMFERHQQAELNCYLSGQWDLKTLRDSAKLWSNFETDYLPVIDLAKSAGIPVVATNITRRYAFLVFKKGLAALDTLSPGERQLMCPLPFPMDTSLSQYRELMKMGLEMHANGLDFALAQAIKDATMAYSMLQNFKPGQHFLHLNGAFHSDYYQGIMWYLLKAKPDLKIVTISTVTQPDVQKLEDEHKGKADFILIVPEAMTRTMH